MKQYLELMKHVKECGIKKEDRTGTGTLSVFGYQMRFSLDEGFPLITTKKLHLKSIIHELLWFLKGSTNIDYLKEHGVSIWDEWADEKGELGPVYGAQWRSWPTQDGKSIDQISEVINQIKTNPDSRRLIVSSWNVSEAKRACQLYQRSADIFLGVPFNIASYALLILMVAKVTNLKPGEFIHTLGDAHLYLNHLDQVEEQLLRKPKKLPVMKINKETNRISEFVYEDFSLEGYDPLPHISAPVAI